MATETERVQTIAGNLEEANKSLKRAARNITGLLSVGRATCDEIKAYNLWALALYNTQRGMLAALRSAGEKNVPELPPFPTLFPWKGVQGPDAWKIDCNTGEQTLTGALRDAMQSDRVPTYLSTDQVAIVTQDPHFLDPDKTPSLSQLVAATDPGLGNPIFWIVVGGIALAVTIAVGAIALSRYWTEKSIQEETTSRTRIQADAFDKYTAARLGCYADCTSRGNDVATCTETCRKLVDKPNLKIDPARGESGLGLFGTIGLVATAAVAGAGALFLAKRHFDRRSAI